MDEMAFVPSWSKGHLDITLQIIFIGDMTGHACLHDMEDIGASVADFAGYCLEAPVTCLG